MNTLTPKQLTAYIFLAIVSLFLTLWVPYIGEEAIYAISAFEMWYHHHYLINTIYGTFYGRPPLLNWLIIPLASWTGWQHVLVSMRFIAATATTLVAGGIYWFVRRLVNNTHYALLCVAIYLTGDLLFYDGWIAYSDPVLSLFIFFSLALLWLAVEEKRNDFLCLAVASLSAGFLVKALSPYWFYGIMGLVLLIFHPNRKFLLRPASFVIHISALSFPFVWNYYADTRYLPALWDEAINTAFSPTLAHYFYQILVTQPGMLLLRLAPMSVVALFCYFKSVRHQANTAFKSSAKIAFWIALINFAICWFAPRWPEGRYYMPVFPLMAICMAYVIWNATTKVKKVVTSLLLGTLIVKGLVIGYFYYHYDVHEPNYRIAARDVMHIVGNAPLIADIHTIESSPVEKVAIHVNLLRFPKPPLLTQTAHEPIKTKNACAGIYVIGQIPTPNDRIVRQYASGKRLVYLFCRRVGVGVIGVRPG